MNPKFETIQTFSAAVQALAAYDAQNFPKMPIFVDDNGDRRETLPPAELANNLMAQIYDEISYFGVNIYGKNLSKREK